VDGFKTFGEYIKNPMKAARGEIPKVTTMTDAALRVIDASYAKHAANIQRIQEQTAAAVKKTTDATQKESDKQADAVDTSPAIAAVLQAPVAGPGVGLLEKDVEMWKEREKAIEANLAAQQKLAEKTVAQFLKEQKEGKAAAKEEENLAAKAEKIRAKSGKRGLKISRADREFLEAFDKIKAAKDAVPQIQKDLLAAQENQVGLLKQIDITLKAEKDMLEKAVTFGGAE
jgi:hypothetical protein